MNKYITKSGQNIYDIALAIYGSIEGVFDLLISNQDISLETVFTKGAELSYHEDFVINKEIASWLSENDITVRNGNYQITSKNIRGEIKGWIEKNNSRTLAFDVSPVKPNGTIIIGQPNKWLKNEEGGRGSQKAKDTIPELKPSKTDIVTRVPSSLIKDSLKVTSKWSDATLDKSDIRKGWNEIAKWRFNLDFESIKPDDRPGYWHELFSNGIILLPTDKDELGTYYDEVTAPKIEIVQSGSSSIISMQIPANRFVAIDWGDNTPTDFFHYQQETTVATHTYEDAGEHRIMIYGHNEYINLDFTGASGIYYALSSIFVQKQFVTPYPNAKALNKLFIIKSNE